MSELVALRKTPILSYAAVITLGTSVGLAGVFLSPFQFVVVMAGLVLTAIALAKTEFALMLLVLAVPLASYRVNLGPVPIDAVTVCIGIVVASYAINNLGKRRERVSAPFAWAFIAFIFFAVVSTVVAPSTVGAVAVIIRFTGYFLLVYIIGYSIKSKETLTWILVLMAAAGALTGLYGIYQYLYEPHTAIIGLYDLSQDVAARVHSTFENPNFYAEYMVLMIPIGLALVFSSRGIFRKIVMTAVTLLLFAGLILTYTRGSWVAVGVGIVLMSLLTRAWLFWVWTSLFAVALMVAPGVASRLASIVDFTGGTAGFRMRLWEIATGIIREHPIIGVGIGNFYNAFTEYIFRYPELGVGWVFYGAHNSYLTIWAETGIFGILSFIAIILVSLRYGLYLAQANAHDRYLSWVNSAIFAGVVGFSINGLTSNSFHHPQGAVFFWFLLGLQLAIDRLGPESSQSQISPTVKDSLILRPFWVALDFFRIALLNHPSHRLMPGIDGIWRKSSVARWLYKEPSQAALLDGSLAFKPINAFLERTRSWFENSVLASVMHEISSRRFVMAMLFITIAVSARALSGATIG